MMRTVALLCVTVICVQCATRYQYSANFDISVEEKETSFRQTVQTDLENNVIYYYTPAHNNILEMYKIQDFSQQYISPSASYEIIDACLLKDAILEKGQLTREHRNIKMTQYWKRGIEVFCFPSKSECYKSALNRTLYLDANDLTSSLARGYGINRNKLNDKKKVNVHKNKWYKTGNQFDVNFIMSKPVKDFVTEFNFPLFEVAIIPENAIILDGMTNATEANQRTKRQTDVKSFAPCLNSGVADKKYGYTSTAGCDWLTFCENTCEQHHIEDQIFYVCLCCPEHHRKSECYYCSKIG